MVIRKATEKLKEFKSEFSKQVSTAIITAFGLVIALTWKDVIVEFVKKVNPFQDQNLLYSAIIVTIISIIGIAIITKWAKKPENNQDKS